MSEKESEGDSSSEGEGMTTRQMCQRAKTTQEIVLDGLMGKGKLPNVDIREVPHKGRAVFVQEAVSKGAYVLEYKTTDVYPRKERKEHEEIYKMNEEGCMILEVETAQGWYCLDATRRHNTLGRLLNHASPSQATVRPFKPLFVKGKWRVGFVAVRDIRPNTELTWTYGCPPEGQRWLMKRPPRDQGVQKAEAVSEEAPPVPAVEVPALAGMQPDGSDLTVQSMAEAPLPSNLFHKDTIKKESTAPPVPAVEVPALAGMQPDGLDLTVQSMAEAPLPSNLFHKDTIKKESTAPPVPAVEVPALAGMQPDGLDLTVQSMAEAPLPSNVFPIKEESTVGTCPYCLRDDIPLRVIHHHVAFCMEEYQGMSYEMAIQVSSDENFWEEPLIQHSMMAEVENQACSSQGMTGTVVPYRGPLLYPESDEDLSDEGSIAKQAISSKGTTETYRGSLLNLECENLSDEGSTAKQIASGLPYQREHSSSDEEFHDTSTRKKPNTRKRWRILSSDESSEDTPKTMKRKRYSTRTGYYSSDEEFSEETLTRKKPNTRKRVRTLSSDESSEDNIPKTLKRKRYSTRTGNSSDEFSEETLTRKKPNTRKKLCTASDVSSEETLKRKVQKTSIKKDTRKYHFCPFQKCVKSVKKISQHLASVHKHLTNSEVRQLSKTAEVATKGARKPTVHPPQQKKITSFMKQPDKFQGHTKRTDKGKLSRTSNYKAKRVPAGGNKSQVITETADGSGCYTVTEGRNKSPRLTESADKARVNTAGGHEAIGDQPDPKGKPCFSLDHPFLQGLKMHLLSRHGKKRTEKEAVQICTEVSKYLYFANQQTLQKEFLLDAVSMDRYLMSLEGKVQSGTQNSKLNRVRQGITYLSLNLDPAGLLMADRVVTLIKNWSCVLAKEARQVNRERLEDLSNEPLEFGDVEGLAKCPAIQAIFHNAVKAAKRGMPVSQQDLRTITIWLAGILMHTNHQRPGAITNMTRTEYERATISSDGCVPYKTIRVREHKTSTTGRASITVRGTICHNLDVYVQYIHPLHHVAAGPVLLFPNNIGDALDHLSRSIQQLGERFNIALPTATKNRHTAATETARSCTDEERRKCAAAMSHSMRTQDSYYVRLKNQQEAQEGFKILADLREGRRHALGHSRPKRVLFTEEEVEMISLYFEGHISACDPPSISECRQFLVDHPMANRDAQKVRDKVRHLIGIKRKTVQAATEQ